MVGQHGINLAVSIVTSHFGDIVAKVCGALLHRGSLSLQELIRFTELSVSQVKNCLLILVQHNCVQAFAVPRSGGFGRPGRSVTLYMALFDNILHRTRFTKFLVIVRDDPHLRQPGNSRSHCINLLEGLLQHGRLTFEQLVVRGTSKPGTSITQDSLRADFNRLVRAHYVERCPRPEPFLQASDDKPAPARRRGGKFLEENPSTEEQAVTAAALSDAERFYEITGVSEDTADVKVADLNLNISVGNKRKHEVLEIDQEVQATITEKEVLWRVNFEKFVSCLKKKVCVANVKSRLGFDAAMVLEAMIGTSPEEKVKDKNSVVSSIDSILSRVRENRENDSMTLDTVRIILEQLGCQLCTEEKGALYTIDLKGIIENCQHEEVEGLVFRRYGKKAFTIFRYLMTNDNRLKEMTDISAVSLVEQKETKEILSKLWKDDYLIMERAGTHATAYLQIFLWKVNRSALWAHTLNEICHAILNLNIKIAQVVEQQTEVSLSKENLEQLRKSRLILESSLLKLDDTLMLFHDF